MRVSAGSVGPGYGCTCYSSLKPDQILTAMARASLVHVEYQKAEPDGTLIFHTWTDPKNVYVTTFHSAKPGKVCKHGIACSAYLVGPWFTEGLNQLRKEMHECQTVRQKHRKAERLVERLRTKLSDT